MFLDCKRWNGCDPGGFGTGKTMTQHQIAKWSDGILSYIGCGERGKRETTGSGRVFELIDPKSGNPLMDGTTLIQYIEHAGSVCREASIYTGLTLAEYYRDMGYDERSWRIRHPDGQRHCESFPRTTGRDLKRRKDSRRIWHRDCPAFHREFDMMQTLNGATGSVSIIGAKTISAGRRFLLNRLRRIRKRFVAVSGDWTKIHWRMRGHFPAIHWLTSYSEYLNDLSGWYSDHVSPKFVDYRNRLMAILNQESSLMEIVKLIAGMCFRMTRS